MPLMNFDSKTLEAIDKAYQFARIALPRHAPAMILKKIVQLADAGERDATKLCAAAVNELTAK